MAGMSAPEEEEVGEGGSEAGVASLPLREDEEVDGRAEEGRTGLAATGA